MLLSSWFGIEVFLLYSSHRSLSLPPTFGENAFTCAKGETGCAINRGEAQPCHLPYGYFIVYIYNMMGFFFWEIFAQHALSMEMAALNTTLGERECRNIS